MKRTNTILWSIATAVVAMAIVAGPAAATPTRGDPPTASQAAATDHSSINAILGPQTQTGNTTVASAPLRTHPSSLNAILGPQTVPDESVSVVEASGGFNWGDAFIGAGVALALVLISGVTFYEVRRHARVTVARA